MPSNQRSRARTFRGFIVAAIGAILALSLPLAGQSSRRELFDWPGFLSHAHSHNDYEQERPLLGAIDGRLTSVEADLWLEDGKILVGHDQGKWRGSFDELYLEPLNQLWLKNALPVSDGGVFLLWLDIKDGSVALREALHKRLSTCAFTREANSAGARVQVILTGDKASKEAFVSEYPSDTVTRDSNIFAEDDPPGSPAWSWYALDWKKIGKWNGNGPMPPEEREHLAALAAKIHTKGRKLRLWSHPATLSFWQEASSAGVDRIGTDRLPP